MSACAPLTDSRDPSDDSPPAPTNAFTISFTGIQSLELTISSVEDITVSAIVRLADEPAPVWADIKDKVGLLSRNLTAGTPKRIFTAKHYGTNDDLQTNIGAMSATDFLQPETAYKVYIFHNESVIETLPFTTAAVPPASEFSSTSTGISLDFVPNVLPFNAEITYDIPAGGKGKSLYEVYGKEGEFLLIPMYMKELINTGWRVVNDMGSFSVNCSRSSCLPNPGYAMTPEVIYQSVAPNTYHKVSLGFQSYNSKKVDAGVTGVIDGSGTDGGKPYVILFIADQ